MNLIVLLPGPMLTVPSLSSGVSCSFLMKEVLRVL